jgi:hypothetical protein
MLAEPEPEKPSPLKNPFVYSSIALLIVVLYVGWVFFSRWHENRRIERAAAEKATAMQQQQDRTTVEEMGGKELAIQSFYGTPGVVRKGGSVQLCYGVANAKTVTLAPQDNPVWPSYSRCVDVKMEKTTTFTLTATNAAGKSVNSTVEIKVK